MANTGIADVPGTIQKTISTICTKTLQQQSVALQIPGVWDRSGEVQPGMDRLDMIELAELAVQTVDETGAAMTPQTINPSSAELDLDQHKSIPFALTKRGELQSKIALISKTVESGAMTLAAEVDDYIFGEGVTAAKTSETAAGTDGLNEILRMKEQFDLDNVPRNGRALVASPVWMSRLLGENNIIRANEYGSSEALRAGYVSTVYGVQIFESSSSAIAADGFLGFGLEAMAFARQRAISFESQVQVLNQKVDYALTHLYGAQSTKTSANPRIYNFDPV